MNAQFGDMPQIVGSSYMCSTYGGMVEEDEPVLAESPAFSMNLLRELKARYAARHDNRPILQHPGLNSPSEPLCNEQIETNMSQKRIVQIFVADPDTRVPVEDSLLVTTAQKMTDLTDQELFFDIEIKSALEKHNAARVKMLDKQATAKAGKDVYLEPIKIRDLKMSVVAIATF